MPRLEVRVVAVVAVFIAVTAAPFHAICRADSTLSPINDAIAAQTAMAKAKFLLSDGKPTEAVAVLEGQLLRADGNPRYLALLRDAYCAHLKELRLAGNADRAQMIRERLLQLDPDADPDTDTGRGPGPAKPVPPPVVREADSTVPPPATPTPLPSEPIPVAVPIAAAIEKPGGDLLRQAEEAFVKNDFVTAGRLFGQANKADSSAVAGEARDRWAYCKLASVVATLQEAGQNPANPDELEAEVKAAVAMSPSLKGPANDVLAHIKATPAGPKTTPKVGQRTADGWDVVDTGSFRVLHRGEAELAGQAAKVAESVRVTAYRKWHATPPPHEWTVRCDIHIHKSADDYAQATKQLAASAGHSTIRTRGTSVVGRRIDLRADDINLLPSTLPHECTHVVLADVFAGMALPRWADEGMAVLAEDTSRLRRYREMLPGFRKEGKLVPVAQLLQSSEYPSAENVTAFYAQSVSVVDYLVSLGGGPTFLDFVHDCGRRHPEKALQQVYGKYGITGWADLEQKWARHVVAK